MNWETGKQNTATMRSAKGTKMWSIIRTFQEAGSNNKSKMGSKCKVLTAHKESEKTQTSVSRQKMTQIRSLQVKLKEN